MPLSWHTRDVTSRFTQIRNSIYLMMTQHLNKEIQTDGCVLQTGTNFVLYVMSANTLPVYIYTIMCTILRIIEATHKH